MTSNADEEDIRNAIMAIRRNRVALKGERGGQGGVLCTTPLPLSWFSSRGLMAPTSGPFWLGRILVLREWTEASGDPSVLRF